MESEAKDLIFYLDQVGDRRRGAGRRHSQRLILIITLMSIMSGYYGYRAIGDFIRRNREDLLSYLQPPKGRLPSFYTVRRVLKGIDFDDLSSQFHKWASSRIPISPDEWISIDGKAIKGAMTDWDKSSQRFVSLVSLYCSKQNRVLASALVDNSKQSEIPVVEQLIRDLDLAGVIFTADALHCQKKQPRQSLAQRAITS